MTLPVSPSWSHLKLSQDADRAQLTAHDTGIDILRLWVVSSDYSEDLRIGPEIDPGVPWTASVGKKPMLLALKSGNFGAPDFFTKAFERL